MKETAPSPFTPKDLRSPPNIRRRRTRSSCSSTSSSLSTSSSSIVSTPSPSYYLQTPFHSSSTIPFSWEQQPGIPKNPTKVLSFHSDPHLPLPPPLRSNSTPRKKRSDEKLAVDPFAVALVECAKDPPAPASDDDLEEFWRKSTAAAGISGGRRWSISDRFGFMDLYGSCKASCSVSESTISIPRPSHRILNRRAD